MRHVIYITIAAAMSCAAVPANAIQIHNDRGGLLHERMAQIDEINRTGERVEISGKCYSTCTMFIGVADVCAHPGAVLGFHGPSVRGRPLPADQFDFFSQVMADYYPANVADWFMETGRHKISGVLKVDATSIVPECQ